VVQLQLVPAALEGIFTFTLSENVNPGAIRLPFTWTFDEVKLAQGEGGFFAEHEPRDVPEMVMPEPLGTVAWNDPMVCVVPVGASLPIFNVRVRAPDTTVDGLRIAQYVLFATGCGQTPAVAAVGSTTENVIATAAAAQKAIKREAFIPRSPLR